MSAADLPACAYWGWGCERGAQTPSGPHSTDGLHSRTWDEIAAAVHNGSAWRGQSGALQGSAYWYFFPSAKDADRGELTWWNDMSDFDRFAAFVRSHDLGGAFTWIATSDAPDWRVHRHIYSALNAADDRTGV